MGITWWAGFVVGWVVTGFVVGRLTAPLINSAIQGLAAGAQTSKRTHVVNG